MSHSSRPCQIESLEPRTLLAHSIIRTAIDANSIQMFESFGDPDIFVRSDGGFGTLWQTDNSGTNTSLNMQLFTPAGNAIGSFFTVAGNIPGNSLSIQFAVDADAAGNFAVVYKFSNSGDFSNLDDRIVLRRYDADGLTIGSAITVLDGDSQTDINSVDVAVRSDGQIVVAWGERGAGITSVKFRRYSAAGALQGSTVTVASESFGGADRYGDVSIAPRDNGTAFAIGWTDTAGTTEGAYVRQYNSGATAVAPAVQLLSSSVGLISDMEIDLDASGNGYMAASIVPGATSGVARPHYIRFNTSGSAVGSLVQITSPTQTFSAPRGVAVSPGGKALFGHTTSVAGLSVPLVSRTNTSATLLPPPLDLTGDLVGTERHGVLNIDTVDDNRYVALYSIKLTGGDERLRVAIVSIDDIPPATPPAPTLNASSDTGISNSDRITNDTTPTLSGTAEPGSTVRIYADITGSLPYTTTTANASGNWSRTLPEIFPNGDATILFSVDAVDPSGNVSGRSGNLSVRIDTIPPARPTNLDLKSSSDTGISNTDNITRIKTPGIIGNTEAGSAISLFANNVLNSASIAYNSNVFDATLATLADGAQSITAVAIDLAGNSSLVSTPLVLTIDSVAPAAPTVAPDMTSASDTGFSNSDNITNVTSPTFTGTIPANLIARLTIGAGDVGFDPTTSTGVYEATVNFTTDGTRSIALVVEDLAGNRSAAGPALTFTIDTVAPPAPSIAPDLISSSDTGRSSTDNITREANPFFSLLSGSSNTLAVLEIDGAEVRRSTSLGSGATLQAFNVPEGLRAIRNRAVDIAGNVSAPGLTLNVAFDYTAPVPAIGSLHPDDDAGPSNSDQITNVTLPRLIGSGAEPGASVTAAALDSAQQIPINFGQTGSPVIVAADGSFSVIADDPAADGNYAFSTRFVDVAGNVSFLNTPIPLIIDTVAPTLMGTSFDINTRDIAATFSKNIFATAQTVAGYVLLDVETNTPVVGAISDPSFSADTATFTIDPTLPRGNYALNTTADLATDLAGNAVASASVEFFILPGDANRDGVVDDDDLETLTMNYGQAGLVFTQGNFDYSAGGAVGLADLVLLTRHYQPGPTALAEPGTPSDGTAPLSSLTIALPGVPAGLDLSRFTIQRNLDAPVSLAGSGATLSSPIPGAVTLSNLSAATTLRGLYRITLTNTGWTADGASLIAPVEFTYHNYLLGDMNSDGQVNNLDIAPFVQGLTSPAAFATTFGYAPVLPGDVNGDGAFNNLDISPFVSLLTGGRATLSPPPLTAPSPTRPPIRPPVFDASGGLFSDEPAGKILQ